MVFQVLNAMMKIWSYFYIVLSKQLIATWMSCVHEHMLISFIFRGRRIIHFYTSLRQSSTLTHAHI